jgi:hypothetical protein
LQGSHQAPGLRKVESKLAFCLIHKAPKWRDIAQRPTLAGMDSKARSPLPEEPVWAAGAPSSFLFLLSVISNKLSAPQPDVRAQIVLKILFENSFNSQAQESSGVSGLFFEV